METEDILMCPGPNEIADRVIRAMLHPAACPVYEEFQELYEQTLDMLAQVFQTTHQVVPIPGSGRSGLESAITSVIERGERTLTIANGQFGELAMRIVDGLGGKGEAFSSPWGAPIDLDAFAEKLASGPYKLVTMVHNETSTGAVYQAGEIARLVHQNGALFLLDAVSSLGGADLPWIPGTSTWR
jgi:alanine-glyoxylate transaminase/serine-glyoxylate transaminase/serine-pyruvate transaminase